MTREEALEKIFKSQAGKPIGGPTDIPANTFLDYLEALKLINFENSHSVSTNIKYS